MADDTSYAESVQALFCAVADYLGKQEASKLLDLKKYSSPQELLEEKKIARAIPLAFKRINAHYAGGARFSLDQLIDWMTLPKNIKWYKSTIMIANQMMKEISAIDNDFRSIESPNFQNLFYFRGDDEIMQNIETLFKYANSESPIAVRGTMKFGNVNKWSPADIYFGSTVAKNRIKKDLKEYATPKAKQAYSFVLLNSMIGELIDNGELLPLSLKQAAGSVTVKKVNFDRTLEEKYINSLRIQDIVWVPYKAIPWSKFSKIPLSQRIARDFKVKIKVGSLTGVIKFRHDPSGGKFLAEYVPDKGNAREGQIAGAKLISTVMEVVDTTSAGRFLNAYRKAEVKFKEEQRKLDTKKSTMPKDQFDHARGNNSAVNIMNVVGPILVQFFKGKNGTKFAKLIFEYSTSRSDASGKFVIAK
ncbi:MAG TPA: hypothetical protein DCW93_06705 [Saprospirales bacterium]|nr:hypothetical protein [Saprospirales bacterium]